MKFEVFIPLEMTTSWKKTTYSNVSKKNKGEKMDGKCVGLFLDSSSRKYLVNKWISLEIA